MTHHIRYLLAAGAIAALTLIAGCGRRGIQELVGEELFSLSLGKLEDQIDLFQLEGTVMTRGNGISMRDGLFYVANGNSGKLMVFSSYGDLIFLLYNPKTNPPPVIVGSSGNQDLVSTRGSVSYPFVDIGKIAIASDKTVFIEEAVSDANAVKDVARGITMNRVILRFDRKGEPRGFIGQEGIGGTPFPFIVSLHSTERDDLVVICRQPDAWRVFWYSPEGALMYQAEIDGAHLPTPQEKGLIASLSTILADQVNPLLYLTIHYYREAIDSSTRTQSAVEYVSSRVYTLDLRSKLYGSYVELPPIAKRKEKVGLKTTEIPAPPSDLLGVSASGFYYLLTFSDTNLYTLQVMDSSGRIRTTRYMVIEDSELSYRDMHLSPTGIIYGLLCDRTKAHISWWRSDLLLKGE